MMNSRTLQKQMTKVVNEPKMAFQSMEIQNIDPNTIERDMLSQKCDN